MGFHATVLTRKKAHNWAAQLIKISWSMSPNPMDNKNQVNQVPWQGAVKGSAYYLLVGLHK